MIESGWAENFIWGARTFNDILTAGIAITAFSLLLYALSFNLRARVSRSFAVILLAVAVIFASESVAAAVQSPDWMRLAYTLQWIGLVFLPAAYLHLSDALLITVGRPSRGRRRLAVRLTYLVSLGFLALLTGGVLLGPWLETAPAPHFQHTFWTNLFTLYYVIIILIANANFWRAYSLMVTRSGRRRMAYLMLGAAAPAMGAYPYLLYGSRFASEHLVMFWLAAIVINFFVGTLLVIMAYAVAFFGVTWPDRVVKARLFKWLLRGPVTASVTLGAMTVVRRVGENFGLVYSALVPLSVVLSVLLMEHGITLLGPAIERWFFLGADRAQLLLLQNMEARLLTQSDLRQFLDTILAAVRDTMQSRFAFIAALDGDAPGMIVTSGDKTCFESLDLPSALQRLSDGGAAHRTFLWGQFLLIPLYSAAAETEPALLGLLGLFNPEAADLPAEQNEVLMLLSERATLALEDRLLQKRLFQTLENIQPQAEYLQKMRAAGRYGISPEWLNDDEVTAFVKDALAHYWGGPKLTENPLLNLKVVRQVADEQGSSRINALRTLLRDALEQVRPEGERRFTTEWILYNILELKFIQGEKVRDVAARLALSEADLYRKQRVAIAEVARALIAMENQAQEKGKEQGAS